MHSAQYLIMLFYKMKYRLNLNRFFFYVYECVTSNMLFKQEQQENHINPHSKNLMTCLVVELVICKRYYLTCGSNTCCFFVETLFRNWIYLIIWQFFFHEHLSGYARNSIRRGIKLLINCYILRHIVFYRCTKRCI